MSAKHYDYFVIGAGSGGVRSARIAAQYGAKVGVAEAADLGGTCVNLGCVPKKLLAYASDFSMHFEDALGFGWRVDPAAFDWPTLITHKNKEIARLNGLYQKTLEKAGVEIITGFARFTDPHTLDIGGQKITADKFLIAVGGQPKIPPVEGGNLADISDDAFHWPDLPKNIVIIGGGYIAVEFAHILHGMGAHVTLLYRGELFLRGFDDTIRKALAEEMRKQGIDLRFNCDVTSIEKSGDNFTVHTTQNEALPCDKVLAAIGRIPRTQDLGLDKAGIALTKDGRIQINPDYQTSVPHIYALGDVANNYPLTPVAIREGHVLADRLFGGQPDKHLSYNNIATAVFSNPPLATVGLTEMQALENGHEVLCFETNFKPMKHTLSGRDERTVMKLVVDEKTDRVLGCHMMGLDAPEIMQGLAIALNCGATKADFDRTMAMHPTSAEEFVTLRESRKAGQA